MKQYLTLFKKDFMELYRTKKILIIALVFIIFALLSPVLARMLPDLLQSLEFGDESIELSIPEATIVDSYVQYISNITQMGGLAIIAVLGGLIVRERKTGLYNNLLNNGVKKANFILSKITVQVLVVTVIYVMACALFSLYNYLLFDEFLIENSILSFLALYIYLLFIISFTNLYSVISKSTIVSIILSFTTMIMIGIFDLFRFGRYLPNYLIRISFNIFNEHTYLDLIYTNIAITLALSIVIISVTIVLCRNKS